MSWWSRRASRRAQDESDLRRLIDNIPDVVILAIDQDLRILEVTGGLSWRIHRRMPNLIGRRVTELADAADTAPWLEAYDRAIGGSNEHFEVASTDGASRFAVDISPLHGNGETATAMVVIRDVHEQRATTEALASTTSRADAILGALHEGVLVRNGHGELVESNEAFNRMFDFNPETDLDPARWQGLPIVRGDGTTMAPGERPGTSVHRDGQARIGLQIGVPTDDGPMQWLRINIVPFTGPDGMRWTVTTMVDETERRAAEHERSLAHARLAALLEHSIEMIGVIDLDTRDLSWINGAWSRILGWDPSILDVHALRDRLQPDDLVPMAEALDAVTAQPGLSRKLVMRVMHADGTRRHLEATFTNLAHEESVGGIVMNAHDVTDRVRTAAELAELAMHDGLTGLPNRRLVLDRISQALEEQRRDGATVAVLYMDLDDFKAVNDSHGHAAGDQLLITVGHRLAGSVRAIDTVGRIGGDEFVIVAVLGDGTGASSVARHIEDALREPITIGEDIVVHINASVGLVLSEPDDPRSATDLLTGADEAMYELKRRRRLRIVN